MYIVKYKFDTLIYNNMQVRTHTHILYIYTLYISQQQGTNATLQSCTNSIKKLYCTVKCYLLLNKHVCHTCLSTCFSQSIIFSVIFYLSTFHFHSHSHSWWRSRKSDLEMEVLHFRREHQIDGNIVKNYFSPHLEHQFVVEISHLTIYGR